METCVASNLNDVMPRIIAFVCGLFEYFFVFSLNCACFKCDLFFTQICERQLGFLSFGQIVENLPFTPLHYLPTTTMLSISSKGCVVSSQEILQLTCKWTM